MPFPFNVAKKFLAICFPSLFVYVHVTTKLTLYPLYSVYFLSELLYDVQKKDE